MSEVTSTSGDDFEDGKIVNYDFADRAVAFFVALSDPKVDKDWSELGKTVAVVAPAVLTVVATRGKAKGALRSLIVPGIALGKLVKDVNGQITEAHLQKAQRYVASAKNTAAVTAASVKAKANRKS